MHSAKSCSLLYAMEKFWGDQKGNRLALKVLMMSLRHMPPLSKPHHPAPNTHTYIHAHALPFETWREQSPMQLVSSSLLMTVCCVFSCQNPPSRRPCAALLHRHRCSPPAGFTPQLSSFSFTLFTFLSSFPLHPTLSPWSIFPTSGSSQKSSCL